LETFEEDAIQKLLEQQNISAREIMVPRNAIVAVPVEASLDEVLRIMLEHKYSRVPVFEDSTEKIIGILHYKDLMRAWQERRAAIHQHRNERPFRIRRYVRRKLVVPESKPLNQLVDEFRQNQTHMAIVVDEFGTISGVVTLEDVFEQIFGEIVDEHDQKLVKPLMEAQSVDVEGTIPIRDLTAMHQIELPGDAGFETLAGFLLFKLGYIPKPGEGVEYSGRRFTILEMERNRIAKVRIDKMDLAASAAETLTKG
jgi:putative hemolysin